MKDSAKKKGQTDFTEFCIGRMVMRRRWKTPTRKRAILTLLRFVLGEWSWGGDERLLQEKGPYWLYWGLYWDNGHGLLPEKVSYWLYWERVILTYWGLDWENGHEEEIKDSYKKKGHTDFTEVCIGKKWSWGGDERLIAEKVSYWLYWERAILTLLRLVLGE